MDFSQSVVEALAGLDPISARCLLSEHLFGHAAEAPALYRAGLLRHGGYRGSIWAALVRELHEGESDPAPLPAPWAIQRTTRTAIATCPTTRNGTTSSTR